MGIRGETRWRQPVKVTGVWALALGLTAMLSLPAGVARGAPANNTKPLSQPVLTAQAQPGVQLIDVIFSTTITVPKPTLNSDALTRLAQHIADQAASGQIANDEASRLTALIDAIDQKPFTYIRPGDVVSQGSVLEGIGTGFVVTPDGYIVTAAHVVSPPTDELKTQFAQANLPDIERSFAQGVAQGTTFTSDQQARFDDAFNKYFQKYLQIGPVSKKVTAQLGAATVGDSRSQKGNIAGIVYVGNVFPDKDIAILKVDQTNLPTVPIGADADVNEGDSLFVAGYPYASTFGVGLSTASQTASVTNGALTAKKSSKDGVPILQTQAPVSPGNSGGPTLDAEGNVVGVLVASATDDQGAPVQGENFAVAVSVVTEKLHEFNITPTTSRTSVAYNQGVQDYFKRYYKRSLKEFTEAQNLDPQLQTSFTGHYISSSKRGIADHTDQTPSGSSSTAIIIVLVVAALAILLLILLLTTRSRGGRKRAAGLGPVPPIGPSWPQPATVGAPSGVWAPAPLPGYRGEQPAWGSPPSSDEQPAWRQPTAPVAEDHPPEDSPAGDQRAGWGQPPSPARPASPAEEPPLPPG